MTFKPGQSGNPLGLKGQKLWRDAIIRAMLQKGGKDGDPAHAMKMVASKLVNEAMKGDVSALKEIGDRIDGKAIQQADVTFNLGAELISAIMDARQRAQIPAEQLIETITPLIIDNETPDNE